MNIFNFSFAVGIRWKIIDHILYPQLKQAQFIHNTFIPNTDKWIPIVTEKKEIESIDLLNYPSRVSDELKLPRGFRLDDVIAPTGYAITGFYSFNNIYF